MTDNQTNAQNAKRSLEEETFHFEKFKFKIELVKWFIVSVVLVILTIIIDKGFKERAAGIQEMQAYDKYVEIILKADNIEDRWKLSEYFAVVTPAERLRNRWIAYKDSINGDYQKFRTLKEMEYELSQQKYASLTDDTMSEEDKKLNEIQNQLVTFERRLVNTNDLGAARLWESKGFMYLLDKDVNNAIEAFTNSENSYNQYHQAYEISRYLTENKSKLLDNTSEFWKTAYRKIATDYSWKMPLNIKNQLLENSK
jgi:hypothetical protein